MKQAKAEKMVDQIFEHGVRIGNIDEDTAKKYGGCVKNFMNNFIPELIEQTGNDKLFNPNFWKGSHVDQWFDQLIDRAKSGVMTNGYVVGSAHAFGKLQELVNHEGAHRKIEKVRVGLKGSIESGQGRLHQLHKEGISSGNDQPTSMKPKGDELEKIIDKIPDSPNKTTIVNVLRAQYHTGGRITAEVGLKVGDIDFDRSTKFYDKDKQEFSRRTFISEQQKDFYKSLTAGKPAGSPVFVIRDQSGKQMDKESAVKHVQNVVREASQKAGLTICNNGKVVSRYTTHSSRRGYAQSFYDRTRHWSTEKLKKETAKYLNAQGSNKEKIIERIQNEKERLNWYRLKNGLPMKDFSWEQRRRLLVALHLGHSRIDHIKRYIEPDPPLSQMK